MSRLLAVLTLAVLGAPAVADIPPPPPPKGKKYVNVSNEVVLGKDGKVAAVVIGVGGFLGMGEREVAVNFDSLRMSQDSNNRTLVTLDATKDSLKAAPEWRWAGDRSNTTGNGSAPTRQPVAK